MNNFLTAKSKEEKAKAWEDLVHSLKQTNHHRNNNRNGASSSDNSRGSQKQRKGIGSSGSVGSSGSNHSLGFIQFHQTKPNSVNGVGGGGMSVTSGLTSAGTATDITQYYVGGRGGGAGNISGSEQQYENGGVVATTPPSVTGGDHKPPLFPVITTTSSSKVVLGGGGGGVDELISPLSDNEYYEDDYDDTPEQQQQEEEEENGVSRALLNVDDTEEELAVYEDEEEEDVSALKGVTLFDSLSSIHVHDDDNGGDVEVPPPPPPPTVMPKLQPPMRDDNSHSVRDMIGRYEKKEVALLEEEESESWSPSMIRRKSDQLFSSPEQEQRKQYQFYPEGEQQGEERGLDENQFSLEWQQQDVGPSPAPIVPTTTAAAAVTTVAATEAPTQRPRKPKKKRFVGGGSGSKCSLEDQIRLVLGNNNNYNSHDEGHTGDNDASASDILRELNSSKDQQQPLRSSPSVINRLPPASISFGSKSKQQQGGEHQQQRISKQSSLANGAKSKKTPALLAPSRRDLHSLRIRQMVSESTLANNDDDVGGSAAQVENTTIATVATTSTTTTNTTRESSVVRPVRGGKGFFTRTGPSSNPTSSGLYSSDMITRDDDTDNFEFYPGLQPNNGGRPTAPQEVYGSSPPRGGAVTPEKPGSPTNSLAESINELKASISELKNAGVGGVGKSTSTLVWNESTGRYVIRDVDDESFDDMVSKGPTVTQESDEDEEEEEEEEQDSSYMFKMPNHITRGSILDDDVVDEAVRLAAMDGMSSASTSVGATSGDESLNNFLASPGEEEEEDAFFVVERSNQNTVDDKWRAFQQSSGNDAFQLNSWGNNNDDGFGDDFADDASFPSEVQWGANDWTDWEDGETGKHFDKMNFVSPASVPSSNRQDPFNPFAQLVLQSLD